MPIALTLLAHAAANMPSSVSAPNSAVRDEFAVEDGTRGPSLPRTGSWGALGEARPGQSSLSAGALRYRAAREAP